MAAKVKSVAPIKKVGIEAIRKKSTVVQRALHSLETASKEPTKMKHLNKWPKAVEGKIDYLAKTLAEVDEVVKSNTTNIKEVKAVLDNNYNNIKAIAEILRHLFDKDKKDKGAIYNTLKKRLTV
jgi:peptidoglycan hydrolase CwlO-like protein